MYFKGNPLVQERTYTRDTLSHPNWNIISSIPLESTIYTTATTFDALNRPISIATPDGGKTTYTYDRGGLLQKIWIDNVHALNTDIITNIEYDAKGQRQKVQYKNGTTTIYEYDPFTFRVRRIRTTRHSDNKTLQDLQYWYDPMGNITLQKDLAQQPVYFDGTVADSHNDYTYDALYRLIQAEGREHAGNNAAPTYNDSSRIGITPIPIASTDTAKMRRYIQYYEYDEVGNFTQMRHTVTGGTGNWTRYYTTDTVSNKLLQTVIGIGTPESYQYDSRGNIINGFGHLQSMEYNAENRLEKVIIDNNRTAYYQYDGAGQRVRKTIINTAANKTEVRKYLGNWETYRRFVSSSLTVEIQRETLHINDDMGRMALVDTRTVGTGLDSAQLLRYQYSNQLSTATLELDETARIISYEEYYPYGSTSFQSGRSGAEVALKRYRYTGKERDEETGLYYHGARYYIPWLARWTSTEPLNSLWYNSQNIESREDLNNSLQAKYPTLSPYNYCINNPIKYIDPDGRDIEGFEKFQNSKNSFQSAINVISESSTFMNYLADFVSMTKGDQLGFKSEGSRSWLNFTFELYSDDPVMEPSMAIIQVYDNGKWTKLNEFNGNLSSNDIDKIRIWIGLSSDTLGDPAQNILTISHETLTHGQRHADMITKFYKGDISFTQFQDYYKSINNEQHLEIFYETNKLYETVNNEIQEILDKGKYSKVYTKNPDPNKPPIKWSETFKFERKLEKSVIYNPNKREHILNALSDD